jgi:hypothetical protein
MLMSEAPKPTWIAKIDSALNDPDTWNSAPGKSGPGTVPNGVEI